MRPLPVDLLVLRSLQVFRWGYPSFLTLALLFYSPVILLRIFTPSLEDEGASGLLVVVAIFLLLPVASAALVYGVFHGLRGAKTTLGQCVTVAMQRGPSIIALAICSSAVSIAGYILCIVPGVVLFCGLFLAGPALVIEKMEPLEAMRRSWALTEGYKLTIFLLAFAIGVVQMGLKILVDMAFGVSTFDLTLPPPEGYGLYAALIDAVTIITTAFNGIAAGVAYNDIRALREGVDEL
ncbi:MAG: hypothetical protein AAF657_05980 [Acidobacteriota bacterium]